MDEFKASLKKARSFLIGGDPEQAYQETQRAIGMNPNSQEGYLVAGKAKFEMGEYATAINLFETAQRYGVLDSASEKLLSKAKDLKDKAPLKESDSSKNQHNKKGPCECCSCCDPNCCYCCPDEAGCIGCEGCCSCCGLG
ncbi:MAG: hypothetical protein AABZ60_13055 [Planctomycetota bacterium]